MADFDRAFEGIILWITIFLIIFSSLYSCTANADDFTPMPLSTTHMIEGQKQECFVTDEYRKLVQHITITLPDLEYRNELLLAVLQEAQTERVAWESFTKALEYKVTTLNLALTASNTELDDLKYQLRDYHKNHKRALALHYVLHGVAAVAVVIMGTAYGVERFHD